MTFEVPFLSPDDIHVWRMAWSGTAGAEPPFGALLSAYAGSGAPAVVRQEHGKPVLPAPWNTLGFNWSHSRDVALFAVGRGPAGFELGVDVERTRPRPRVLELAHRFFAPTETAWLETLTDERRLAGFLDLWTHKEAVLKAHGGGLSYGLHRVSFMSRDDTMRPQAFDGDIGPASSWCVRRLDIGDGTVAAVAWRGAERNVRVFTYPP